VIELLASYAVDVFLLIIVLELGVIAILLAMIHARID
jgi:hypothetical protein